MLLPKKALATSVTIHCGVIALLIASARVLDLPVNRKAIVAITASLTPPLIFRTIPNNGGGGGSGATLPASLGHIPKPVAKLFIEPSLTPRPVELTLESGLLLPMAVADVANFGDPFGVPGPPSGGTGQEESPATVTGAASDRVRAIVTSDRVLACEEAIAVQVRLRCSCTAWNRTTRTMHAVTVWRERWS
jgi:hypothetical protein